MVFQPSKPSLSSLYRLQKITLDIHAASDVLGSCAVDSLLDRLRVVVQHMQPEEFDLQWLELYYGLYGLGRFATLDDNDMPELFFWRSCVSSNLLAYVTQHLKDIRRMTNCPRVFAVLLQTCFDPGAISSLSEDIMIFARDLMPFLTNTCTSSLPHELNGGPCTAWYLYGGLCSQWVFRILSLIERFFAVVPVLRDQSKTLVRLALEFARVTTLLEKPSKKWPLSARDVSIDHSKEGILHSDCSFRSSLSPVTVRAIVSAWYHYSDKVAELLEQDATTCQLTLTSESFLTLMRDFISMLGTHELYIATSEHEAKHYSRGRISLQMAAGAFPRIEASAMVQSFATGRGLEVGRAWPSRFRLCNRPYMNPDIPYPMPYRRPPDQPQDRAVAVYDLPVSFDVCILQDVSIYYEYTASAPRTIPPQLKELGSAGVYELLHDIDFRHALIDEVWLNRNDQLNAWQQLYMIASIRTARSGHRYFNYSFKADTPDICVWEDVMKSRRENRPLGHYTLGGYCSSCRQNSCYHGPLGPAGPFGAGVWVVRPAGAADDIDYEQSALLIDAFMGVYASEITEDTRAMRSRFRSSYPDYNIPWCSANPE